MDAQYLRHLLGRFQLGQVDLEAVLHQLRKLPFDDLGYAKIDNHRSIRTGVPEVIFCQGKTIEQIQGIAGKISQNHDNILATRADRSVFHAIEASGTRCTYYDVAKIVVINPRPVEQVGNIAVLCAGTSDIAVAEEAAVTAEILGNQVTRIFDVGVAGIHRLLGFSEDLFKANVAVVCAGMEGALPSVVAGLVPYPVIGVPTSVGYGASFGGVAALLSMLNSCASGVSVVNIDNGFGAGYQGNLINKVAVGKRSTKKSEDITEATGDAGQTKSRYGGID